MNQELYLSMFSLIFQIIIKVKKVYILIIIINSTHSFEI